MNRLWLAAAAALTLAVMVASPPRGLGSAAPSDKEPQVRTLNGQVTNQQNQPVPAPSYI